MCAFLLVDTPVFVEATIVFVDVVGCRIASKQEISYFRDASLENASLVRRSSVPSAPRRVYGRYKFRHRDAYLYVFLFYGFNK